MTRLVDGLVVHADRMRENLLDGSLGLVFSQPVLLALVAAGLDPRRRLPHRAARRAPRATRSGARSARCSRPTTELAAALGADGSRAVLDEAFDLDRVAAPRAPRRSTRSRRSSG